MIEHVSATDLAAILKVLQEGDEEARLDAVRTLAREPDEPPQRSATLAVLIEAMGDDSWQVRKESVASVLCWNDMPLLSERLVEAMGEPDNVGRRNAVIDAVMKLGVVAIEPLLAALKQKPEHRKVLVDVLGTYGDTRVIPALGESLLDEDPNVRAAAMEQLASFTSEEVVPALRAALRSPDLLVILAALDGLNRQRVALPIAELQPMLEQTVLRPALMTALGHTRDAAALPLLLEGLLEKARGAREAALVALFRLHQSLPADGRSAIEAAAQKLDQMAVHSALRALMEASPPVRQATAALIGWTGRREMLRPLLLALGDADADVVQTTGLALLQLAGSGEPLAELLPTLDSRTRGNIYRFFAKNARALRTRTAAAVYDRLIALVEPARTDKNPQTAAAAAEALTALGPPSSAAAQLSKEA